MSSIPEEPESEPEPESPEPEPKPESPPKPPVPRPPKPAVDEQEEPGGSTSVWQYLPSFVTGNTNGSPGLMPPPKSKTAKGKMVPINAKAPERIVAMHEKRAPSSSSVREGAATRTRALKKAKKLSRVRNMDEFKKTGRVNDSEIDVADFDDDISVLSTFSSACQISTATEQKEEEEDVEAFIKAKTDELNAFGKQALEDITSAEFEAESKAESL